MVIALPSSEDGRAAESLVRELVEGCRPGASVLYCLDVPENPKQVRVERKVERRTPGKPDRLPYHRKPLGLAIIAQARKDKEGIIDTAEARKVAEEAGYADKSARAYISRMGAEGVFTHLRRGRWRLKDSYR